MTSTRSRPGHLFGANPLARRALDPTDLGFEEALDRPEVQVTLRGTKLPTGTRGVPYNVYCRRNAGVWMLVGGKWLLRMIS